MMKIVAIIQARMGSSRLPGKVLKDLCGQPMLGWVVGRTTSAKLVNQIIVATTTDVRDDAIVQFCQTNTITCFRGSPNDVLDRYYQAAKYFQADIIVRITADCPLIDPELIDKTIKAFLDSNVDFAANRLPPPFMRTYPIGLDVEVVSFYALERAWKEATELHEREHVMPYFYEVSGRFKIITLDHEKDLSALRWTVDTTEDLEFIRQILKYLHCRMDFSWKDVLEVIEKNPELLQINAQIRHKTYKDVDEKVKSRSKND